MMCNGCKHHKPHRYISSGVCTHPKAYRPNGEYQAAVVAIRKCEGKYRE